jgi:LL-diaminopimelate aminotransferase
MPAPAERLTKLPNYIFAVISDRLRAMAAQKIDVIRLDIGNPDLPPPNSVVEVLADSAHQATHHGYTDYRGTPSFRAAVARYYQRIFGVTVDADTQVLPLMGSKEGLVNLALAYIDKGDVALAPSIGYPAYTMGPLLAGGTVHYVPLDDTSGGFPQLNSIPADVLAKAKLLWTNYPNNPTGTTATLDDYRRMIDFCRAHNLLMVSDNPYIDLVFDGARPISPLQLDGASDVVLEFISCSKSYNMAGWRLGAAVGSAEAVKHLLRVKSNMDSGHFRPVYDAGIEALDNTTEAWLQQRTAIYQHRRDRIMAVLADIGLEAKTPRGSLYVWAKVQRGDAAQYLEDALQQAHVVLAPGLAYGPGGAGYVRFSYAVEDDRLDEALVRLKEWYAKRNA